MQDEIMETAVTTQSGTNAVFVNDGKFPLIRKEMKMFSVVGGLSRCESQKRDWN